MFAPGVREVRKTRQVASADDRRALSFVRSAFCDADQEVQLRKSLAEAEDAPALLLPPGWEQRVDSKSLRIFFVDHNTCSTTWDDPRTAAQPTGAPQPEDDLSDDQEGAGAEEVTEGAAVDLAALCVGVVVPKPDDQFRHWIRAVERNAHDALRRATDPHRSAADIAQWPRFMLVQTVHRAVVRQLLVEPRPPTDLDEPLQLRRDYLLAKLSSPPANGSAAAAANVTVPLGGLPSLPKDAMGVLTKHTSAGLTNTYRKRAFGASKLNLRKVRKLLGSIAPQPGAKLPFMEPSLPETLHSQLLRILLFPPGSPDRPAELTLPAFEPLDVWATAADATISLSFITGSLLTLLQLPRAIYCRGAHLPAVPLARRLHALVQRAASSPTAAWEGFSYWAREAGLVNDCSRTPPESAIDLPAEDAAAIVLIVAATLSSTVWHTLGQREGAPPHGASSLSPEPLTTSDAHEIASPSEIASARSPRTARDRISLGGGGDGGDSSRGDGSGRGGVAGWRRRIRRVVASIVEMSLNMSTVGAQHAEGKDPTKLLTSQVVTEAWQPLAVELRKDTLLCLIGLAISLLTGSRAKREMVSAICTLRLLTVHLLLYRRCGVDVGAFLSASAPAGQNSDVLPSSLKSLLVERLIGILLHPLHAVEPSLRHIWASMQAEVLYTLTAGMGAFFSPRHASTALLHACLDKQRATSSATDASAYFAAFIAALMRWLASQPTVSSLLLYEAPPPITAAELHATLPRALSARQLELVQVQSELRTWILDEIVLEARRRAAECGAAPSDDAAESHRSAAPSEEASDALQLLAACMQEILAKASLSNEVDGVENQSLLALATKLLACANDVLAELPVPDAPRLAALHRALERTFIGALLPWLADSLSIFSAFAFEYSMRLLPRVLALLQTLRTLLDADADARAKQPASAVPQKAAPVRIGSAHPYKASAPADKKMREKLMRKVSAPVRHEEKHEWPGATQLHLSFDRRCCTDEGDHLTLTFFKGGRELSAKTLRMGGNWSHWPRSLTVAADTLHVRFYHASDSFRDEELWGYSFSVVAAKRWSAGVQSTPALEQLQTSLVYLGAKCTSLLITAEPVIDEEKENRHWLDSPLLNRGLPLQLPPDHPLMHPFFGIALAGRQPQEVEDASASADVAFLDDLASLSGSGATHLHAYLLATTPELVQSRAAAASTSRRGLGFDAAERALLASLLSYNGCLATARQAAALVSQRPDIEQIVASSGIEIGKTGALSSPISSRELK